MAVPAGFAACSLGEGVTPECDPAADPDQANACFQVAECDNGNGGVIAEESCCVRPGSADYEVCMGLEIDGDFRDLCVPGSISGDEQQTCCNASQNTFDLCMAGSLSGSGAGGSGGSGGSGGGGAGGDSSGGSGGNGSGGGGGGGGN